MKKNKAVGIAGLGVSVPKRVLSNFDLEKMVDTSDEWIRTRTGIRERRIADNKTAASDLAAEAARKALADARLKAQDVELIIVATLTPDMISPATACLVQAKLGARNAACFDLNAACAGFIYALTVAAQFIAAGAYKNALVIGAEVLSKFVDWRDRSTCVLFGDGAGAAVLKPVASGGIMSTYLGSDGSLADLLYVPAGGSRMPSTHKTIDTRMHYLKMNGREVFKNAVRSMVLSARSAVAKAGLNIEDIDMVVPHQANIRIIDVVAEKLGLGPKKVFVNVDKYGNMSSASTIVALTEAVKKKKIKRGDHILMVAFGAGLAWGACVIKWTK